MVQKNTNQVRVTSIDDDLFIVMIGPSLNFTSLCIVRLINLF